MKNQITILIKDWWFVPVGIITLCSLFYFGMVKGSICDKPKEELRTIGDNICCDNGGLSYFDVKSCMWGKIRCKDGTITTVRGSFGLITNKCEK